MHPLMEILTEIQSAAKDIPHILQGDFPVVWLVGSVCVFWFIDAMMLAGNTMKWICYLKG